MRKHHVFVVDDSRLLREWIAKVLRSKHIEVSVHPDGTDCIQALQTVVPDVIILDMEMERMGGMEALTHIRSDARTDHIPVLIFTTDTALETKVAALEAGANDFLSKEADEAELVARVNSLLRVTDLESQLISERNKLSSILNDLANPVVITDVNERVILINGAGSQLFNIAHRDLGKIDVRKALQDLEDCEPILEVMKSGSLDEVEVVLPHEGAQLVFRVAVTSVFQSEQNMLGKAILFHDVTKEKEIQRMKSDFISMIAHDLRSPISVITGYTSLLLEGKAGDLNETQQEFLDGVTGRARAMLKLVDEFLTVSELEANCVRLDIKKIDVQDVVDEAVRAIQIVAATKKIGLSFDRIESADILGDGEKLLKVFSNLIDNAVKYTPDGGQVKVSVESSEDGVRVSVKDNGIGISDEENQYIFDRYARASAATTRKIKGTGLGLAIVRQIVDAHAGKVWVDSAEGKGSTFHILLPTPESAKEKRELAETIS